MLAVLPTSPEGSRLFLSNLCYLHNCLSSFPVPTIRCSSCNSITIKTLFSYIDEKPFHLHPTNFQSTMHELLASNLLLQPSYQALVLSAKDGCDLCQLFINQFSEHGLIEMINLLETQGEETQIKLSLRCFNRDDTICTLGTLFVSCGKTMRSDAFWPYGDSLKQEGLRGVMMKVVRRAGQSSSDHLIIGF